MSSTLAVSDLHSFGDAGRQFVQDVAPARLRLVNPPPRLFSSWHAGVVDGCPCGGHTSSCFHSEEQGLLQPASILGLPGYPAQELLCGAQPVPTPDTSRNVLRKKNSRKLKSTSSLSQCCYSKLASRWIWSHLWKLMFPVGGIFWAIFLASLQAPALQGQEYWLTTLVIMFLPTVHRKQSVAALSFSSMPFSNFLHCGNNSWPFLRRVWVLGPTQLVLGVWRMIMSPDMVLSELCCCDEDFCLGEGMWHQWLCLCACEPWLHSSGRWIWLGKRIPFTEDNAKEKALAAYKSRSLVTCFTLHCVTALFSLQAVVTLNLGESKQLNEILQKYYGSVPVFPSCRANDLSFLF